jgi:hypothetical protein
MAALRRLRPGWGLPVYLPSSLLRYVAFKLSYDLQAIPALNELTRWEWLVFFLGWWWWWWWCVCVFGGERGGWVGGGMPSTWGWM